MNPAEPTPAERHLLRSMLREEREDLVVEIKDGKPCPAWDQARACEAKGLLKYTNLSGGIGPERSHLRVQYKLTPRGVEAARAALD